MASSQLKAVGPVVVAPGGWVEIDRPIVLRNSIANIIRGDGTTNLRYVGPPTKAVIQFDNCQRCRVEGIAEIHCGQAESGIVLTASNESPISVNDNIIDGPIISGGEYGIVIGDGVAKSISENTISNVQLHGRKAGLRIESGNGQNIYLDRVRINGCPIGIDLINGGLQDRGGIITYCETGIRIGRINNVAILSGSYSEGCTRYIETADPHSTNPGQLTLTGCHVQGEIRWGMPGPLMITGCEIDGKIYAGGQFLTPVTVFGTTFLDGNPFVRMNDTGTFLAIGCQQRIQAEAGPVYRPITSFQFASETGLAAEMLSWGPSSARGLKFATLYGKKWTHFVWDGGGRIGGGEMMTEWPPAKRQ